MKIAIITPVFPPYAGGMGNVAFHHARLLQARGFSVTVFTPSYKEKKDIETVFQGVEVAYMRPMVSYGNAAYLPKLKKKFEDYDIICMHYPFFGSVEAISSITKPLVIFYHMDVVGKGIFQLVFSMHKKIFLPKIISTARKIMVSSFDYIKNSDIKVYYKAAPDKFSEIPNGVDTKIFYPKKDLGLMEKLQNHPPYPPLIKGGKEEPENKIILFVGGLDKAHYFKGVDCLLNACAQLKINYKLIIVGKGDLADDYKLQAKKLKIKDKVIFCADVTNHDLPKYYNAADVVVLPSIDKSEAFGMVLVEGMACGKPVIATNLAGVRSVVENGINGILVEPKNEQELARALEKILSDDESAKKMGEAGLEKAREKYDWEVIGDELAKIFNF